MMPISDPRERFFYPHHTPMKDTYIISRLLVSIGDTRIKHSQENLWNCISSQIAFWYALEIKHIEHILGAASFAYKRANEVPTWHKSFSHANTG